MPSKLYEERYCAFIDILGFSDHVTSTFAIADPADRDEKLRNILELNEQFSRERSLIGENYPQACFSHFSDSIFVSIPTSTDDAIGALIHWIQRISTAIMVRRFLTRGAVVRGVVHHDDGAVFGPSLVSAYRLESQVARYPRVMVAKNVRDDIAQDSDAFKKLIKSSDGPYYINCLQLFENLAEATKRVGFPALLSDEKQKRRLKFLNSICGYLENQLDSARDDPRVFEKVRWITQEINERVIAKGDSNFPGWPMLIDGLLS